MSPNSKASPSIRIGESYEDDLSGWDNYIYNKHLDLFGSSLHIEFREQLTDINRNALKRSADRIRLYYEVGINIKEMFRILRPGGIFSFMLMFVKLISELSKINLIKLPEFLTNIGLNIDIWMIIGLVVILLFCNILLGPIIKEISNKALEKIRIMSRDVLYEENRIINRRNYKRIDILIETLRSKSKNVKNKYKTLSRVKH